MKLIRQTYDSSPLPVGAVHKMDQKVPDHPKNLENAIVLYKGAVYKDGGQVGYFSVTRLF